jgi:hypothetical protein
MNNINLAIFKSKLFKQDTWRYNVMHKKNLFDTNIVDEVIEFLEHKLGDNSFLKTKYATMRCQDVNKTYHPTCYKDIQNGWHNGLSLQIRQLQHELPIGNTLVRFARALERFLLQLLESITLFITPRNAQAAPLHYDTTEIFTVQLLGKKNWTFYNHEKINQQTKSLIIEPGALLYIPAGLPHQVKSMNCFSISAAIIFKPLCYDLLETYVIENLISKKIKETTLPVMGDSNSKSTLRKEIAPILQEFKDKVNQLNTQDIKNYIKEKMMGDIAQHNINFLKDFQSYNEFCINTNVKYQVELEK